MNAALVIILLTFLLSVYLGIRAKKGKDMNLEQWTVGGRGFGTIFVFVLMAGEIYTTFTFLGGSGWAYAKGGPTFYIVAYGCLAYVMSYFLLPKIWRYAKDNKLVSQSDFFVSKFNSPTLGILVSLIGVVAMIPYLVLQLEGLGIIVSEASYGTISSTVAIWLGVIAVTIYVMISGIHGSAWTAVVKDSLILIIVLFLGIYLPIHYYGGFQPMFEAIENVHPNYLALPAQGMSTWWFITTVLLTSLGFYMWPHTFGSVYSATDARVFRKNAIYMPLYQLILVFVFFVGFAAILQVPGLSNTDMALFSLSKASFDPWFVGFIGAAGILCALVPGSMLLMTAATLLSKNIYKVLNPKISDDQVQRLSKWLVPVIALIAIFFTFQGGQTIVALLLMGYSFVTQLFPALIFSLRKKTVVNKYGAFAGMLVGVLTVAYVTITEKTVGNLFPFLPQFIKDFNVGVIAMILNIIVLFAVSGLTRNLAEGKAGEGGPVVKEI